MFTTIMGFTNPTLRTRINNRRDRALTTEVKERFIAILAKTPPRCKHETTNTCQFIGGHPFPPASNYSVVLTPRRHLAPRSVSARAFPELHSRTPLTLVADSINLGHVGCTVGTSHTSSGPELEPGLARPCSAVFLGGSRSLSLFPFDLC